MAYISKSRKVAYPFMTLFLENRNGSTTWYGIETNLSSAEKIGARMERFDHGTPLKSLERRPIGWIRGQFEVEQMAFYL
jgi:hypothetical protein